MSAADVPHDRIGAAIRASRDGGRTALIAFLTGGFPDRRRFHESLAAVADVADVVEIGVPFTDPMADGVTIQRASHAALAAGFTLASLLDELAAIRPRPPPQASVASSSRTCRTRKAPNYACPSSAPASRSCRW